VTLEASYEPKTYKPGAGSLKTGVGFAYASPDDVLVTHVQTGRVLVRDLDYILSKDGSNGKGTIIARNDWPADDQWRLERTTPRNQRASLKPDEALPVAEIERSLDERALVQQEQDEELARAPKVGRGEAIGSLPTLAQRKGNLLLATAPVAYAAYDVDGNPTVDTPDNFAAPAKSWADKAEEQAERTEKNTGYVEEFTQGISYDTREDGEGATPVGKFFRVPIAGTDPRVYTRYQRTQTGSVEAAALAPAAVLASRDGATLIGLPQGGLLSQAITYLTPQMFGAKGDGETNDQAAFDALIAFSATGFGHNIVIPPGSYYVPNGWVINRPVNIRGEGSGISSVMPFVNPGARIYVDAGVTGLRIASGGNNANIMDLAFLANGKAGWAFGVDLERRAQLTNVFVTGFSGNGFNIDTSAGGNANLFRLTNCHAEGCDGHGLYIDGPDSNAGTTYGFNAVGCLGYGIYDSSFLGNHHYGAHSSTNTGAYFAEGLNATGSFIGCYSENKQWEVASSYFVKGGSNSFKNLSGPAADSSFIYVNPNTTQVKLASVSNGGSNYATAPDVTFSAPTGGVRAEAEAYVADGKIRRIDMKVFGKGYGVPPLVTILDPTGTGAKATARLGKPLYGSGYGQVWTVTIDEPGENYTNPTIIIAEPQAVTATGYAIINSGGAVIGVFITNKGEGYVTPPTVSFSNGGGSGAAAIAELTKPETSRLELSQAYGELFRWRCDSIGNRQSKYLRHVNYNSGDLALEYNVSNRWLLLTGESTQQTFGRASPQAFRFLASNLVVGSRHINVASTVPPTTGQWARGDVILAEAPSPGGSPGVVCTTGGTAGVSAVFKPLSNLSA